MASTSNIRIPIVLSPTLDGHESHESLIELTCSRANISYTYSWSTPTGTGVALGCKDGSLFLFGQPLPATRPITVIPTSPVSPQASRTSNIGQVPRGSSVIRTSRPPSPSPLRRYGVSSTGPSTRSVSPAPSITSTHTSSTHRTHASLSASSPTSSSSGTTNITAGFAPQRSRIVTGPISREQVSAPTTYVDYDDEPEKLKNFLKQGGVREKTALDGLVPHFGGHEVQLPAKNKGQISREAPSRMQSMSMSGMSNPAPMIARSALSNEPLNADQPTTTNESTSSSPLATSQSDYFDPAAENRSSNLQLRYHVLLRDRGEDASVVHIQAFDQGRKISVLQEHGVISIIRIDDGICYGSLHAGQGMPGLIWIRNIILQAPRDQSNSGGYMVTISHRNGELFAADNSSTPANVIATLVRYTTSFSSPDGLHCILTVPLEPISEDAIALTSDDKALNIIYINREGRCICQPLYLPQPPNIDTSPVVSNDEPRPTGSHILALPQLHAFRALATRSVESLPLIGNGRKSLEEPRDEASSDKMQSRTSAPPQDISVGEASTIGQIWEEETEVLGASLREEDGKVRGVAWTNDHILIVQAMANGKSFMRSDITSLKNRVYAAKWIDESSVVVACKTSADIFVVPDDGPLRLEKRHPFPQLNNGSHPVSRTHALTASTTGSGQRTLQMVSLLPTQTVNIIWTSGLASGSDKATSPRITAFLPLGAERILYGSDDGFLRASSLLAVSSAAATLADVQTADAPVSGSITHLTVVESARSGEKVVIGGASDGGVIVWDYESLQIGARWTLFGSSLCRVIHMGDAGGDEGASIRAPWAGRSRLWDCVLCVASDGSIAVIALDGLVFQYLIPGSATSLERIYFAEEEERIILVYGDKARFWDLVTGEFRRSAPVDKVDEMKGAVEGAWRQWNIGLTTHPNAQAIQVLKAPTPDLVSASTLILDVNIFIQHTLTLATGGRSKGSSGGALDALRGTLALLLTPGLNEEIDRICETRLGIPKSHRNVGLMRHDVTTVVVNSKQVWKTSEEMSAVLLANIAIALRAWVVLGHNADEAQTVLLFYTSSLPQAVGSTFVQPSLATLGEAWIRNSGEPQLLLASSVRGRGGRGANFVGIREAEARVVIRSIFEARLACMEDSEMTGITEQWLQYLPVSVEDAETVKAATALFLCGNVAISKFTLLSSKTLTDIAKSIALYIGRPSSAYRALSIDLSARGFEIWQHHTDASALLRQLFLIATSSRKDEISTQNLGPQARAAVVAVAGPGPSTPLFMSTLVLEILHPQDVGSRRSVMQLVAFLVRKKPMVIQSSLPRLVESVVKSLDPASTSDRDAVFDAATEILGQVVQTFPSVDFHSNTQRLAVGTGEGAIIMYDLKTATRLYVLEGHRKGLAACSFSPDGRRLVTASVEEGAALVWKVGSSLSSFFNPGAPPRQGTAGGEPFKTFPFMVPDAANITQSRLLEAIRFEWTAERNVKLKISDTTLTFSTG